jgi:hypothetical protein
MSLLKWFSFSLVGFLSISVPSSRAGTLTATFNSIPAGSAVNLTTNGVLDWVHWGLFTETSVNRKGGVTPQISDFTPVDASNGYVYIYQYADNANGYTWSDGTPHMAVTNTTTGVWAYGIPAIGSGFRITVPAGTNLQTLKVYVGAFAAKGKFTATLSDNSAPDYTNPLNQTVNNFANGPSAVYALTYAANFPGQNLTVTYTLEQVQGPNAASANVTLQAATLTAPGANNIPFVSLTSLSEGTSVVSPTNLTLTATATDIDGLISFVEFYAGSNYIGTVSNAPYSFIWTNPPVGRHFISARATDDVGAVGSSVAVTVFVATNGGSLSGTRITAPLALNLTLEGTSDWAHWGLLDSSSFNHKTFGGVQISNFTPVGTNLITRFTDNRTAFSWTDGSPVNTVANTNAGVYINGLTNGFEFSVPADTNARTLRVYAGLYGAQGNFQAWLSDFSGRAFTDLTLSNVFGNSHVIYTLNYAAASAGQQLHVRWTIQNLFDVDYGNVTLAAATLQGPLPPPPLLLQRPGLSDSFFRFSFASLADQNYAVQFTPSLAPTDWQTFTNLLGTGGTLSVTDQVGTATQRFYRVLAQ